MTGGCQDDRPAVTVITSWWDDPEDERAHVLRGVAGALSREAEVEVVVLATPGGVADGAFDVIRLGAPTDVAADADRLDDDARQVCAGDTLVVAADDTGALDLASHCGGALVTISAAGAGARGANAVWVGCGGPDPDRFVGMYLPVHPLAAQSRHNGLGATGYLLVLSDRRDAAMAIGERCPPDAAAWLAARFPREWTVVVEDAVASVWRWRSLRGTIAIDTRMDLWRLVAHAAMTVDLRPGPLLARECVESLRYGVPVVVPEASAGALLVEASGGGRAYSSMADLFDAVTEVAEPVSRATFAECGRIFSDRWYGDPHAFVIRIGDAVLAR